MLYLLRLGELHTVGLTQKKKNQSLFFKIFVMEFHISKNPKPNRETNKQKIPKPKN